MGSLWSAVNRGKVKVTGQTIIIRAITNAQGITTVNLPYPGAWMVSLVHMVRVTGVKRDDLQAAMALLKKEITDIPLSFNNFRD